MKRWKTSLIFALTAIAVPWTAAFAATATPTPAAASTSTPGQGLEISPPVLNLSADPGQTVTATIRVRNVSSGILIVSGRADDFGASGDESGEPKLLLNETGETRYSLKYWIPSVPNLTLAPQELKTAVVNINVPKNAEPGGHFGVIRFTATPPSLQGTGVSLSASVGTLILLRVSGTITDNLTVASMTVGQSNHTHWFFEHGPIDFTLRLQNNGSVHEKPVGSITVKNLFGKTVGTVAIDSNGGNVLPGSIRRFTGTLSKKSLFGRYTATYSAAYLDKNHKITKTISFWVIPWKLLILALIALFIVIWLIRLGLKRYNAYIIRMARSRR